MGDFIQTHMLKPAWVAQTDLNNPRSSRGKDPRGRTEIVLFLNHDHKFSLKTHCFFNNIYFYGKLLKKLKTFTLTHMCGVNMQFCWKVLEIERNPIQRWLIPIRTLLNS